jgi:calpain-7
MCNEPSHTAGTYTLVVSSFEPRQTGTYLLEVESTAPVSITPIAAEGAGMFSRVVEGIW